MSTLTPIRARHQHVAKLVSESFGVDVEDALNGIRRSYSELREFLAGEGPGHVFVCHHQRGEGGDTEFAAAAATTTTGGSRAGRQPGAAGVPPPAELLFSVGGNVRLQPGHKLVYFLRAADGAVDLDKVRRRWSRRRRPRCCAHRGFCRREGLVRCTRRA